MSGRITGALLTGCRLLDLDCCFISFGSCVLYFFRSIIIFDMHDNRSCGGILCSFLDLVTLNGDPDGVQGLDLLRVFFRRIFVIEGNVYSLEAAGLLLFDSSADSFGHGVEVFDGAEDHLRAFGEGSFVGFDMDGHLCLFGKISVGQISVETAGADGDGVVKDSCGIAGSCFLIVSLCIFAVLSGLCGCILCACLSCFFRGDVCSSGLSGRICGCYFLSRICGCYFFGRIFCSGFCCPIRCAFICFSVVRISLSEYSIDFIFFRKNDFGSIVLSPVDLSHVEVKGQPAGHFFACPGRLSFFIIGVCILFDCIRAEGEDQIGPFAFPGFFIIDFFCPDHSTDKLLAVPFQFFAGEPCALDRFQAKVGCMPLGVRDLKIVIIYVLRGNTVLTVVDCLDLFICQMKCIREAVSGYVVGRVDSVFGERIAQVYTDEIFRIQLRILVSFVPVCDGRAVLNFLIFRHVMVVNAGAAVQDSVKIQSILFRDIGIPVFCIFICGKTGRERGSGFFPFLAAVFIFFTVLVNIIGSGVGIVLVRAFILYVSISICFIL